MSSRQRKRRTTDDGFDAHRRAVNIATPQPASTNQTAPAFTPGPWRVGYRCGICRIPAHVKKGRHPGPPGCVYVHEFWPGSVDHVGGITSDVSTVDVVWTEYDELKIRPDDARLIAAAPDLYAALTALRNEVIGALGIGLSDSIGYTNARCLDDKCQAAFAALAKATGR